MFEFSEKSLELLNTCDKNLQNILFETLEISKIDFSIVEGHRTRQRQLELINARKSNNFRSKHLLFPSHAVDIVPCFACKNYDDRLLDMCYLVGIIDAISKLKYGDILRFGAFWDRKNILDNKINGFLDVWHIELK